MIKLRNTAIAYYFLMIITEIKSADMDDNIGTFYLETGKTNDFSSTYRTTFPPV